MAFGPCAEKKKEKKNTHVKILLWLATRKKIVSDRRFKLKRSNIQTAYPAATATSETQLVKSKRI